MEHERCVTFRKEPVVSLRRRDALPHQGNRHDHAANQRQKQQNKDDCLAGPRGGCHILRGDGGGELVVVDDLGGEDLALFVAHRRLLPCFRRWDRRLASPSAGVGGVSLPGAGGTDARTGGGIVSPVAAESRQT